MVAIFPFTYTVVFIPFIHFFKKLNNILLRDTSIASKTVRKAMIKIKSCQCFFSLGVKEIHI